jgi:Leucine-rich repeat (LRR) protein
MLEWLEISNAGLFSTLPAELGNLTGLVYMDLSQNQLHGSLPTSFAKMQGIEGFYLSGNNLSGAIPPELFTNWTELLLFGLSDNSVQWKHPSADR